MNTFTPEQLQTASSEASKAINSTRPVACWWRKVTHVGSVAINGCGKDIDLCALIVVSGLEKFSVGGLTPPAGWEVGGSARVGDKWESWKHTLADGTVVNLLVTMDEETFDSWRVSTQASIFVRALLQRNLMKWERVALHRIIQEHFDGSDPHLTSDISKEEP